MYNGVIPTLTGSKPGRFAKRGVSGLLSFAGERGTFIGFGRFELFLTYLIASHERIFFFFSMCLVCSSNFCVHAVIQLSACLLSYFGPLYMANDRS